MSVAGLLMVASEYGPVVARAVDNHKNLSSIIHKVQRRRGANRDRGLIRLRLPELDAFAYLVRVTLRAPAPDSSTDQAQAPPSNPTTTQQPSNPTTTQQPGAPTTTQQPAASFSGASSFGVGRPPPARIGFGVDPTTAQQPAAPFSAASSFGAGRAPPSGIGAGVDGPSSGSAFGRFLRSANPDTRDFRPWKKRYEEWSSLNFGCPTDAADIMISTLLGGRGKPAEDVARGACYCARGNSAKSYYVIDALASLYGQWIFTGFGRLVFGARMESGVKAHTSCTFTSSPPGISFRRGNRSDFDFVSSSAITLAIFKCSSSKLPPGISEGNFKLEHLKTAKVIALDECTADLLSSVFTSWGKWKQLAGGSKLGWLRRGDDYTSTPTHSHTSTPTTHSYTIASDSSRFL